MKTYELMAIIKTTLDTEEVDEIVAKIEDTIKNYKGEVVETDKIGRKKLAYEVQNYRDGFFVVMTMKLPAEKVADFKKQLRLNDNIVRTMFVTIDEKQLAAK